MQSNSSATLAKHKETAPPPADTTPTEAGRIPGQPTQDMFRDFFSPRSPIPHPGRTEQPPEHEEEGPSRETHQGNMSVQVGNNRHFDTNAEIGQNRPEYGVTQASYYGNDVARGSIKIGGMTHQDGKESGKDKKSEDYSSENRPEHGVTQASYYGNDVAKGSIKIGGMTHQVGKESGKDEKSEDYPSGTCSLF